MSATVQRNHEGVILRYHPDAIGRHHVEQRAQPTDAERIALIKAEKGLADLVIILDHLSLSDTAINRLDDALHAIYEALQLKRPRLGLCVIEVEQAA
jgi:hypothetical protein